jgi:cobalt-zinc-cadmium efflux system membrane fusion protein
MRNVTRIAGLPLVALAGLLLSGCGQQAGGEAAAEGGGPSAATQVAATAGHDHGGWWCTEHGVPEGVCARCSSKLAAEFQKKGDWCKEHNRPESQCFICHPELEQKFAAQYEAKFGSKPPKPEADEEGES